MMKKSLLFLLSQKLIKSFQPISFLGRSANTCQDKINNKIIEPFQKPMLQPMIEEQAQELQSSNSPTKELYTTDKQLTGTLADYQKFCQLSADPSAFNEYSSLTEKEIYSHDIIRDIFEKNRKKTVHHDVNKISAETKLYAVPRDQKPSEFEFDSIPPKNTDYSSTCSQKVKEINLRLGSNKDLSERLAELALKNKQKCSGIRAKARPASAEISSSENHNKRVSVSGLVSYSFNSVKARRSLGNIPESPEEEILAKKINAIKKKTSCSEDRKTRIIHRRPNQTSLHRERVSKAAVCDFHMPTDKFLKNLISESQKDKKIYGQRLEKLNCVKEYMEKEATDYEQASYIVDAILAAQQKQLKQKRKKAKYVLDDDLELAHRRTVLKSKRIMLKNLYFADV